MRKEGSLEANTRNGSELRSQAGKLQGAPGSVPGGGPEPGLEPDAPKLGGCHWMPLLSVLAGGGSGEGGSGAPASGKSG